MHRQENRPGVWRTPGAAVQERAGATFLFCSPIIARNAAIRNPKNAAALFELAELVKPHDRAQYRELRRRALLLQARAWTVTHG